MISLSKPEDVVTAVSMRRFMLPSIVLSSCRIRSFLEEGNSSEKSLDVAGNASDSATGLAVRETFCSYASSLPD